MDTIVCLCVDVCIFFAWHCWPVVGQFFQQGLISLVTAGRLAEWTSALDDLGRSGAELRSLRQGVPRRCGAICLDCIVLSSVPHYRAAQHIITIIVYSPVAGGQPRLSTGFYSYGMGCTISCCCGSSSSTRSTVLQIWKPSLQGYTHALH